jgi:hypothetical protein
MLIARCAVKAGAATLLTWNVRHFVRLGQDIARIVKPLSSFERHDSYVTAYEEVRPWIGSDMLLSLAGVSQD